MATRDAIASKIRENLDDAGITWYNSGDINESIDDGYNEILVYSGCLEKQITLSFQSELAYYDFATLIPDFYCVTHIYNKRNNRWLHPSSPRILDSVRIDWEIWNAEPQFFFQVSSRHVCLIPTLTAASGEFLVFYRARGASLSAIDVPQIFLDQQDILELYGTGDMLEEAHEWIKAGNSIQHYNKELEQLKERVKRLGFPDRTMYVKRFDIYPRPL